jgi:hypothetical protein
MWREEDEMTNYPQNPQYPGGSGDPNYPAQGQAGQPQGYGYPAQGPGYAAPGYGQPAAPGGYWNPYGGVPPGYYPGPPQSSGVGTASFVIGLIAGLMVIGLIVAAALMTAQSPTRRLDEKSSEAMTLGCALLVGLGANVLGVILALVNFSQKDRKKLFGILGLVFNGGLLLIVGILMLIGLAAK